MNISVLGSTGSIGVQTLEVAESLGARIVGLAAGRRWELLLEQVLRHSPMVASIDDEEGYERLSVELRGSGTRLVLGHEGLMEVARMQADIVVNALVGSIGLVPTLAAIEEGRDIALANKETIVAGGALVMKRARERGVRILPIDSEHSAILQCLAGNDPGNIKIYLTASGGPFRGWSFAQMSGVTPEQALKHPTWNMGAKISIDSATMMNKGLEVIEARWLFGVLPDSIKVLVHPQSIVHSMVEFGDGAIMAQLGASDMRTAIQYALTHPRRVDASYNKLDMLSAALGLSFEPPDTEAFPCLALAYQALRMGGHASAVLSAANEVAVELFLKHQIGFTKIPRILNDVLHAYTTEQVGTPNVYDIDEILQAEAWAKKAVGRFCESE